MVDACRIGSQLDTIVDRFLHITIVSRKAMAQQIHVLITNVQFRHHYCWEDASSGFGKPTVV